LPWAENFATRRGQNDQDQGQDRKAS
jgi:hypothetical protein